jgi:hypothetical protein
VQQNKITKKKQKKYGKNGFSQSIWYVAYGYICIRYSKSNKGYGYIFALVDVLSRKAYAYPMKNKKTSKEPLTHSKKKFNASDVKKCKTSIRAIVASDS